MYSFPELIKKIRKSSDLTQKEFSDILEVSTVLISMIESGQKEVSKNFIIKLSNKLEVNPSSITPFLYIYKDVNNKKISKIEKSFIELGERLQDYLINKKAKDLQNMYQQNRYPKIRLRSKNELAKRISSNRFPYAEALNLVNRVSNNFDKYWHDIKSISEPSKNKFVRSAKYTPLEKLLRLINDKILAPYDNMVPEFIFGGLSGKDHVQAAYYLLGNKRKRSKLSLDIYRFFEQNHRDRVFHFFNKKCECSVKASNLLADLCCVPFGPKGNQKDKVLARGFSTSTRLALWCNIDLFLKVYWAAKKFLKKKDVRITIFVDDIGITASNVTRDDMEMLSVKIEEIFCNYDPNQKLPLNEKKDIKIWPNDNIEHLGLALGRNKIRPGRKTRYRQDRVRNELSDKNISQEERKKLTSKKKSYKNYSNYVRSFNKTPKK